MFKRPTARQNYCCKNSCKVTPVNNSPPSPLSQEKKEREIKKCWKTIVLFFFPLIYYFTHTGDWYRRPIDPMMVILAAYALAIWFGKKKPPEHRTAELHRLEMAQK